jgi:hypothetical protein
MTPSTVQDDLAFLRSLANNDVARRHQALFGRIYFGAGVIYGAQVALSIAHNAGWVTIPGGDGLLSLAATGVFVPWLCWEIWKQRGLGAGTLMNRAINAAFAAVGAANVAALVIVFVAAARLDDGRVALLSPCLGFALQGAGWFMAYLLRRRAWLGIVALGWTLTSIAMAFNLGETLTFLALIAAGILFCMALPGFVMMRLAREAA